MWCRAVADWLKGCAADVVALQEVGPVLLCCSPMCQGGSASDGAIIYPYLHGLPRGTACRRDARNSCLSDVHLQVWMASDAALLTAAAAEGALKHAHYFQGGVIGGELLTLSRHPIAEVRINQACGAVNRVLATELMCTVTLIPIASRASSRFWYVSK